MYRLARTILYDSDECKDVVSGIFAQMLEDPMILLPEKEEAYLMRSVRNRCLNIIAHKSVREKVTKLMMDRAERFSDDRDNEQLDRLMLFINQLEPPIRKQILQLKYLQEMTYQDIANELGIGRVTVYNHLIQAMNTVKQLFKQARQ